MPPRSLRSRFRRWILRWLLRVTGLVLFAALVYEGGYAMQIWQLREKDPQATAIMFQRLQTIRQQNPKAQLAWKFVPYTAISLALKRALIVAEDARFVEHNGFDWDGIRYAMQRNLSRWRIAGGGSSISQQLAKNLFLSDERSLLRKAHEVTLTLMLEAILSKRRIFEIYLNVIEWGDGIFGAEAAALHHFKISAKQLDDEQAAQLAAMVPRPRYYDQRGTTPYLEQRASVIASQMRYARVP